MDWMELDKTYLANTYARFPLTLVRGEGSTVWDDTGKAYTDLSGGIAVFGQTFVMLFTAIIVTKDRSGSFLTRLFASPMKSSDFTGGYILPMVIVAFVHVIVAFAASMISVAISTSISSVHLDPSSVKKQ